MAWLSYQPVQPAALPEPPELDPWVTRPVLLPRVTRPVLLPRATRSGPRYQAPSRVHSEQC
jgi:hypothetical protein